MVCRSFASLRPHGDAIACSVSGPLCFSCSFVCSRRPFTRGLAQPGTGFSVAPRAAIGRRLLALHAITPATLF